jgi:hypothetical protein
LSEGHFHRFHGAFARPGADQTGEEQQCAADQVPEKNRRKAFPKPSGASSVRSGSRRWRPRARPNESLENAEVFFSFMVSLLSSGKQEQRRGCRKRTRLSSFCRAKNFGQPCRVLLGWLAKIIGFNVSGNSLPETLLCEARRTRSPFVEKLWFSDKLKRRMPFGHSPFKKQVFLTPYGGITHIRLKGRSLVTSSQPAYTSSPETY